MAPTPPDRNRSSVSERSHSAQEPGDGVDWGARRRPASAVDRTVSRTAHAWLQHLPPEIMPRELVQRFPRVLNQIAVLWQAPQECRDYFDSLLIDRRGRRRGFPLAVLREISALSDHYQARLGPGRLDRWQSAPDVTRARLKR